MWELDWREGKPQGWQRHRGGPLGRWRARLAACRGWRRDAFRSRSEADQSRLASKQTCSEVRTAVSVSELQQRQSFCSFVNCHILMSLGVLEVTGGVHRQLWDSEQCFLTTCLLMLLLFFPQQSERCKQTDLFVYYTTYSMSDIFLSIFTCWTVGGPVSISTPLVL